MRLLHYSTTYHTALRVGQYYMYNVMNIDVKEKFLVLYIGNTGILVITRDQGHGRLNVSNKDDWGRTCISPTQTYPAAAMNKC